MNDIVSFISRIVICRIRLFPTLISKIKWLGSKLLLIKCIAYAAYGNIKIRAIPLNTQYKNNFHTRIRTVPIHVHQYNVLSSSCHPSSSRIYKRVLRNEYLISMLLRPNPTLSRIILRHLFL